METPNVLTLNDKLDIVIAILRGMRQELQSLDIVREDEEGEDGDDCPFETDAPAPAVRSSDRLVSYHHTDQARIDSGHSNKDFI